MPQQGHIYLRVLLGRFPVVPGSGAGPLLVAPGADAQLMYSARPISMSDQPCSNMNSHNLSVGCVMDQPRRGS